MEDCRKVHTDEPPKSLPHAVPCVLPVGTAPPAAAATEDADSDAITCWIDAFAAAFIA